MMLKMIKSDTGAGTISNAEVSCPSFALVGEIHPYLLGSAPQ